jgi:hypothetical protein
MKLSIIAIANILFFQFSFSQVNSDTIKIIAKNFYIAKLKNFESVKENEVNIKEIIPVYTTNEIPDYYIINMQPKGFVILANEYSSVPILAYSFENGIDNGKTNPAFEWWMKQKSKEINFLRNQKLPINSQWEKFYNVENIKTTKSLAPLIVTKWDQGKYYNTYCPADPNGPDGHCVTGCVATAVSQLMYYHRWPHYGTGCHSYYHNVYGTIEACFDTCYYDYNEMTQTLTNYNHSAALLLYTTGISFDMEYGPNGSGVWNHSVANSMKTYFKYCQETRYIFRDSTNLNWDSLIITNLDARKPLYYAGWEDTTFTMGHAFICDGYQDTGYYHFNWGWGGYADGYFYTNQLNPAGSNFNFCQELIVDIYPDTLNYYYPLYCNNDTVTYSTGTISTNNGSKPYLPNSYCTWLLNPDCGKIIQLQFNSFELAEGDTLFIFDGENELAPIIQYFNYQNSPILINQSGTTTLKSSSNKLFIKFISDNINESYGFNAYFKTIFCGVDTLTTSSGIITDGSNTCDYLNYTNCRWIIKPQNAQSIKIEFTKFELADNNSGDFVTIYKNSISSSNQIAQFNAFNPPSQPIYVPSGIAIIRFITNSAITAAGWEAFYEGITNIVPQNYNTLTIHPNPVNYNSQIISNLPIHEITISDLTGKIIAQKQIANSTQIELGSICQHLKPGIYFCNTNLGIIKMICIKEF